VTDNHRRSGEEAASLDHNYHIHNDPLLVAASSMEAVLLVGILTAHAHRGYTSSAEAGRLHTASTFPSMATTCSSSLTASLTCPSA